MKQLFSIFFLDDDGALQEIVFSNLALARDVASEMSLAYGAATLDNGSFDEQYRNGIRA